MLSRKQGCHCDAMDNWIKRAIAESICYRHVYFYIISILHLSFYSLSYLLMAGVPSLKRSELETACEQFSNIIGSSSNCTLCKGTLSSGVEIAVTTGITSAEDWKEHYEVNFRNKVSCLLTFQWTVSW